jgi:ADP-ribose pyrophosphatase
MSPKKHDGGWIRRSSEYLFESKWFRLRQDRLTLPSGEDVEYTLVEHAGYVVIVPMLSDGRVVMERIYRHTLQETVLECPSGGLDADAPEEAARRELLEETGYVAGKLEPLGRYYGSSGISDEAFWVFLATELHDTGSVDREPTEQMELELVPLDKLAGMAETGAVTCGPSALSLMLAARHVERSLKDR